jgi:hypothetical protein
MWAASKPEPAIGILQVQAVQKRRFFLGIVHISQQACDFDLVPQLVLAAMVSSARQVGRF